MKKIVFILSAILALIIFSCKKKENTPETPAVSTTGSTSTSTVPAYYGVLYSYKMDMLFSGTLTPMNGYSGAYFSPNTFINNTTISEGFTGSAPDAGTVTINSIITKKTFSSGSYYFGDSTNTLLNSPHYWSVSGANGVPPISYTNTSARPAYTGYSALKDTIKLSQNNVLSLTGISGADEIDINLFGGSGLASKNLAGDATNVTFTTADLSSVGTSTNGSIMINVYKNTYQAFGGKNYKFKIGYTLYKQIVVQ
jgi:hypothetical protein